MKIEKYSKDKEYSYTLGAFPTYELVKHKAQFVEKIIIHSKLKISKDVEKFLTTCESKNIPVVQDDKTINKLADKENCFIIGIFKKYKTTQKLNRKIVLVNPMDMGNLGTIMRTALGFGFKDIILVKPCADIFNPKTIRASMGAVFSLNFQEFENVNDYLSSSNNQKFIFRLTASKTLGSFKTPKENFDLVFGNESSGLPKDFNSIDNGVIIKHSKEIDSLNLPISVGIALYEFTK